MSLEKYTQALRDEREKYVGRQVTLNKDDPTGADFYGEQGMYARITSINPVDNDSIDEYQAKGQNIFEYVLDFNEFMEHNKSMEQPVWRSHGDKPVRASETSLFKDDVISEMWFVSEDFADFVSITEPSPVYEAWRKVGGGERYHSWLEKKAEEIFIAHPELFDVQEDAPRL